MGFLFFPGSVTAGAANGVKAGVYVPIANLPGIQADELADSEAANVKESKVLKAVAHALYAAISKENSGLLGLSAAASSGANSFTQFELTYTFTVQYLGNIPGKEISQIPLPTKGSNMMSDKQSIKEVFPNASVVADDGAISGEGIVIETSTFSGYEDIAVTAVDSADDRDYLGALIRTLPNFTAQRSEITASAMTSFSLLDATTTFLDADATDETNPTTGIDPDDLSKIAPISLTTSLSIEVLANYVTEKFDVNVVTS